MAKKHKYTASQLRVDIYRVLDQVLETGIPVEVERKGGIVRLVPQQPVSKLDRLPRRDFIHGDPEKLVHVDWSTQWKPKL